MPASALPVAPIPAAAVLAEPLAAPPPHLERTIRSRLGSLLIATLLLVGLGPVALAQSASAGKPSEAKPPEPSEPNGQIEAASRKLVKSFTRGLIKMMIPLSDPSSIKLESMIDKKLLATPIDDLVNIQFTVNYQIGADGKPSQDAEVNSMFMLNGEMLVNIVKATACVDLMPQLDAIDRKAIADFCNPPKNP